MYKSKASAERAYAAYRVIKHLKRFLATQEEDLNGQSDKTH